MLRNLRPQPQTNDCRDRVEGILSADIRVKNAKARIQERGTKVKTGNLADNNGDQDNGKRRRLDELKDQAMMEEDPAKLNDIFEKRRKECSHIVSDPGVEGGF